MYPQQNYDFIINPQQPQKRSLLSGSSTAMRLALVLGVVFLLLISFVMIRNLLTSSGSNQAALVAVVAQQQELIRLSGEAADSKAPLSDNTRNAAITTELSLNSSKTKLLAYMQTQGQKVKPKELIDPNRKATDTQLSAALSAGNYEATFKDVLAAKLADYRQSIKTAFNKTKGAKGRELLNSQYKAAELLERQVNSSL